MTATDFFQRKKQCMSNSKKGLKLFPRIELVNRQS